MLCQSSESSQWRSAQLFCPVKCFVASVINRGRFYLVIGDFMKPFFSAKLFLFKFTIESKLLRCVIERKFTTRRSRPNDLREVDFVSPRNPFPSCRYRRCNGGWCLPTSGRRGAPGTTPGAPPGRGSRTWIFGYDNCCTILIMNVYFKR